MKRRGFLALLAGAGALGATGCSTTADARAERGSGVIVAYAAPFEKVWAAVPEILKELGLRVAGDNTAEGYILVEQGASAFSWGERVAIYVERIGTKGNSRVEVVSKGALGVNITATDWAKPIHDKLAQRFKRL
jgi:uncharacterized lipoprotein